VKDRSRRKCSKRSKEKDERLKGTELKYSMALTLMYCLQLWR